MQSVERPPVDSASQNEGDAEEIFEEDNIFDTQCSGIQSLVRATKKSINVSTVYLRLGTTFLEQVKETGMELCSEFIFTANCSDLWKYFKMKLKQFSKLFQDDDYLIVKRILMIAKLHLQNKLVKECREKLGKDHKLVKDNQEILAKHKKRPLNITLGDFKCSQLYIKYLEKQIIHSSSSDENYRDKLFAIFSKLQIQHLKKNDHLLVEFLYQVLNFVYITIRSSNKSKSSSAISIYLIIIYLKISVKNEKYIDLIESRLNIQTLYMNFLGKLNGILKIVRYFEDAPKEAIKDEYECTKQRFREMNI